MDGKIRVVANGFVKRKRFVWCASLLCMVKISDEDKEVQERTVKGFTDGTTDSEREDKCKKNI